MLESRTAERYPRLASYLGDLPGGLASYPECLAKTSLALTLLDGMPSPRPVASDLPEPVSGLLKRPSPGLWMPEVEVMALTLTIADHHRMTDDQSLDWLKYQNRSYFRSLMYRATFAFLSPGSVIPKAAARWAAVHRGSQLSARLNGRNGAELTLTFPPKLFVPILLRHFTAVFQAVLEHSNGHRGEVTLVEMAEDRGVYRARWE